MKVPVIVVDRCDIVRRGLASLLKGSDFEVARSTSSVRSAIEHLEGHADKFGILVCDFQFEDGTAMDLQIVANRHRIPLVLFSDCRHPIFLGRLLDAGSKGLIPKSADRSQILNSLQVVQSGRRAIDRKDTRRVTGALAAPRLDSHIDFPLTQREFAVLREVASGKTNRMVAEGLGLGYETVKEHVQNILVKLQVKDRTQAAVLAARHNLL